MTALKSAVSAFVGPIRFVGSLAVIARLITNATTQANVSACHSAVSAFVGPIGLWAVLRVL